MKRYRIKNILKIIGDIFVPLLPGIICAGLCGASASLIAQIVPDYSDSYIWAFTEGKTMIYQRHLDGEWLTRNDLSDNVAADLKKRGFKFLGSTLIYSYLQSIGVINDHDPGCSMFIKIGGVIVR